ncbi:MFS transporter [Tsukamurella conjunctivitidis]|uniref:MFS transporter n=3 Tax=Tsukamurellaceae TaxID=85028 RepID=A0A5C5S7C9_9ACTN|nr:MFS transporter [Tsukamurella columbiensis]TWS31004.1 MFS transporter [Tsukamurella conjunctivitidis]
MGTSEFMLSGVLPGIAADLDVSVAAAGGLISAFAAGMALGAPLTAALARRWPPRSSLLGFLVAFAAAHVVAALTASFSVLVLSRVVAAFANAGFLAVALATAVAVVGPERRGRAVAVLLSGTTLAMVAGVPAGAVVGDLLGWRSTFLAVAALCLPPLLAIAATRPAPSEAPEAPPQLRAEIGALRRPRVRTLLVLASLVNAGTFGFLAYLAVVVVDGGGLRQLWVPVALMVFGVGAFAGIRISGRWADTAPQRCIETCAPLLLVGWVVIAVAGTEPAVLLPAVAAVGVVAFATGGTLIARIVAAAADAPTMGGAFATAALNAGALLGPIVAGWSLGPAGAPGPAWCAAVAVALAGVLAVRMSAASGRR